MKKWLYVMTIIKGKTYNKVTKAVITRHVENLKKLDADGKIELCGPFKGCPGVAGMVIFKTQSYEEAEALCKLEPLVEEGYATYTLAALQVADKDNNYLL
ncbi:MAG: YciI family protein [Lachnospiraceae bacterium]|nr:YciI family protein [Lachnospiraceae bacterium]